MGDIYVVTFIKEKEVDEPCWSINKNDEVYISGWIKTICNIMYNTTFYGIKNIEEWVRRRRIVRPEVSIIDWRKISNYN